MVIFKSCLSNTWVMRSCPFACTTSETKFNKTVGTHEASENKKETAFFWLPVAPLLLPFHHCSSWAVCSGESVTGRTTGLSKCDFFVCMWFNRTLCTQHKTQNCPQVWCFPPLLLLQMAVEESMWYRKTQLCMCSGSKWWSINNFLTMLIHLRMKGDLRGVMHWAVSRRI